VYKTNRPPQVGLGEASFCSLASPFIDDAAPPGQKTRWLALFFMCIPVGVGAPAQASRPLGPAIYALTPWRASPPLHAASGFILGKVMGDPLGWRAPFATISLAMVPFVVFCALAEPISLRGLAPAAPRPRSPAPGGAAAADGDAAIGCVVSPPRWPGFLRVSLC